MMFESRHSLPPDTATPDMAEVVPAEGQVVLADAGLLGGQKGTVGGTKKCERGREKCEGRYRLREEESGTERYEQKKGERTERTRGTVEGSGQELYFTVPPVLGHEPWGRRRRGLVGTVGECRAGGWGF